MELLTAASALQFLYEMRRGKAAHADKVTADFDHLAQIATQAADAKLLRYMARASLERAWLNQTGGAPVPA